MRTARLRSVVAFTGCTDFETMFRRGSMANRDEALKRKMALFRDLRQRMPDRSPFEPDGIQRAFAVDIESFPMGRLENVDSIHLNWVNERFFEYVPDGAHPLRFSRSTGEQITPGRMFTDGAETFS